jgi:hypothetical protein
VPGGEAILDIKKKRKRERENNQTIVLWENDDSKKDYHKFDGVIPQKENQQKELVRVARIAV